MVRKLAVWSTVLLFCLSSTGCYFREHTVPFLVPANNHEKLAEKVAFLQSRCVQVVITGDKIRFIIPTDFYFYPDSAEFRKPQAEVMWTIASILNECPNPVYVTGHTDDIGSDRHKHKRSFDQAFTIASYLWESGVAKHRLTVSAFADHEQIADDRTVHGSSYNRRVEVRMD
ncbi:MAG: OmpA family protein [Coxiellaceae bacterium]|nr:OmpA family protein [Coxiellaceae bacterium]